ncbi:hypothetical protein [uncultured Psychroserpens sp.]|uniref:hypothetical protein n=1 Tax=uncultured Psychroserpens sp. TaxID=255436 RepID=UPI0026086D71|nr:hypothetical protein [uncultured Psychroserpens sp.]
MKDIFNYTYEFLMFLSRLTGFTYKEVNIIIWFILIPLSWMFLIDKIRGKHFFKIGFLIIVLLIVVMIRDFSRFSNQLFDHSANFLRGFDAIGSNYTASSVIICLMVPLIIYLMLIEKAYFRNRKSST